MSGEQRTTRDGMVSVITIFLNAETFLEEAIRSVLDQTYGAWELLLVDDGSTDGSTHLAREYAERHPERIRYMAHPDHGNHGMSASRNLGIRHARGEFIALLDADDIWLPQKLERQVAALDQNPRAELVSGPTLLWHGWTGDPDDAARDFVTRLPARPERVTEGVKVLARILQQRGDPLYTCSILARRQAVLAVGGFEEQFRGLFEDQAFFAKFLIAHPVYVIAECLDRYRQHPDSCSGGVDGERDAARGVHDARLSYLRWLSSYVEAKQAPPALRRVLARELWLERHPRVARVRGAVRSTTAHIYSHVISQAFRIGRVIIPRTLRQKLWRAVAAATRARDSAAGPT